MLLSKDEKEALRASRTVPMHRKARRAPSRSFYSMANGGEPEFNCRVEAADQNLAIG